MVVTSTNESSAPNDDDLLVFADEAESPPELIVGKPWKVVVVDDDEQVHVMSRLVCHDRVILGRRIEIIDFYSTMEAMRLLPEIKDVAVFLLDVVMETDDAGLHLVKFIRNTLKWQEARIVLRTGQPGRAPELDVIEAYDINDYKTKHELTHDKLLTTLVAALRNYEQLRLLSQNRRGLEVIVNGTGSVAGNVGFDDFAKNLIDQLRQLIGQDLSCIFCSSIINPNDDKPSNNYMVLGGNNEFTKLIDQNLEYLTEVPAKNAIKLCLSEQRHFFEKDYSCLYLRRGVYTACIYIKAKHEIEDTDVSLLSVFAATAAIGFENLSLFYKLEYTAYFDPVTGLPNRNNFARMLDRVAEVPDQLMNVCLIEVDHFDDVFDGLGHDVGNELMRVLAERMVHELRGSVIARTGTSIFGVYGPSFEANPKNINQVMREPCKVGPHTIPISFTYGLCNAHINAKDGTTLLKYANIALHRAGTQNTHKFEFFRPELEDHMQWRLNLIYHLRDDFRNNRLAVWFQPKINIETGHTIGFEALVRWEDKPGHFIEPSVFIPLAEYSGLIVEIGYWVLEQACASLEWLESNAHSDFTMAVNVSVPQFRSANFTSRVEEIVSKYKVKPSRLLFEVTESIVIDEPRLVIESLSNLRKKGFKVSIDDFGTGYSSLSYLQDLPLDELKIDRSFTAKITTDKGRALVSTITDMCKALSLSVIAEGVETEAQSVLLKAGGCLTAQGFLFSPPIPRDQILAFLTDHPGNKS